MDLVALLPWWAGVTLALASYLLFHTLATRKVVVDPHQVGNAFPAMMIAGVSLALQYLVPALCLLGALGSFLARRNRASLVTEATASKSADALNAMSWREFELLVGEAFRLQGYEVKEQGGVQPDGGVDLRLRKGNETFLVQCKQWKAWRVGVDVVRELYGVMAAEGAAGGFVVTSGRFTEDAIAFAVGRNVRLVDGSKLFGLLQQTRAALSNAPTSRPRATAAGHEGSPAPVMQAPACPKCNSTMVRRTAKKGPNAGHEFWGCSRFPTCHGTR